MLPISLVQIVSRIRGSGGDCIEASSSAARSRSIRSACAVVAFADQQHVSIGGVVDDNSGRDQLIGRKDHAADDPLPWRQRRARGRRDRESSSPEAADDPRAGRGRTTTECRSGQTRPRCRRAAAARRPAARLLRPVAFSVLMTKSCGPSAAGSSDAFTRAENSASPHAKRQAVRLHRLEMRPAHHAGHIMPGKRKPHRKMAADRARAEDADSHGGGVPDGGARR